MNIYPASEIQAWDNYTLAHEPISSINLMERAATAAAEWILKEEYQLKKIVLFCGPGNNGADGLAIARLLHQAGKAVVVYVLSAAKQTPNFDTNLSRLQLLNIPIHSLGSEADFPLLAPDDLTVEALYGTGLSRPLHGFTEALVLHLNQQPTFTISIDMPAGLPADVPLVGQAIMAQVTLSFQCPKLAFFMAENEPYCGQWHILDIGLSAHYSPTVPAYAEWIEPNSSWLTLRTYRRHAHKHLLGHALISAGSLPKLGAAILTAAAALRSGNGLLTMALPSEAFGTLQNALPEAMCMEQDDAADEFFFSNAKISAVGIGPGWGLDEHYAGLLENMLVTANVPLVIDATALYHLSANMQWIGLRPPTTDTIITPHAGEFARLFGSSTNSFDRHKLAIEMARENQVFIVLKGAFTQVITPEGKCYFNCTGNAGMAKGGSGDVLTGIITSLLAQRYSPLQACILGVYAHGLAGDFAAKKYAQQGMKAMDIVNCLPKVWKLLG